MSSEGLLPHISLSTSTLLPAFSAQKYPPLHFIPDTIFSLCCLRNRHLFKHIVHLVLTSPWKLLQVSFASASLGEMSLFSFKETRRVWWHLQDRGLGGTADQCPKRSRGPCQEGRFFLPNGQLELKFEWQLQSWQNACSWDCPELLKSILFTLPDLQRS